MKKISPLLLVLFALFSLISCKDATLLSTNDNFETKEFNETNNPMSIDENTTTEWKEVQKMTGENKLIVAGKEHHLPEKQMVFQERADHSSTVELPFVTVLESLGAKVGRSSGEVTELEWNGKKYLLNNVRATLVAEGTNFNCIIPAPGSKVSHQIVDGVFLLDWVSIRTVTEMMGISIKAEIDYQNHIVIIDKAS